jgi:ABC-type bacteriocin/lantibiotic exporter with double-glycine peptidase domain
VLEPVPRFAEIVLAAALIAVMSLCLSCASVMSGSNVAERNHGQVLPVPHAHSKKSSDCLAVCVSMVLKYYDVPTTVPDTALPWELASLSNHLNSGIRVDDEGHILFSTVLQLGADELTEQLSRQRPVIIIFRPSARAEYHSVVVSGYGNEHEQFFIHDPSKRKPYWKELSNIPTFEDSGKHLAMLVGIREQ